MRYSKTSKAVFKERDGPLLPYEGKRNKLPLLEDSLIFYLFIFWDAVLVEEFSVRDDDGFLKFSFKCKVCSIYAALAGAAVVEASVSATGATVGISGYSRTAPSSHLKIGQQCGKAAVLLVFSVDRNVIIESIDLWKFSFFLLPSSNLHLGLAKGRGPQSSTSSKRRGGLSSVSTQVERPQNGVSSQVLPGSTVAHLVLAKHMPGKSANKLSLASSSV